MGADGVAASFTSVIPPHGARFIRTAGTTAELNKGWAELSAPATVNGNSIFGLQTPGQGDSEAAVPLSPAGGTDLFLPFDNTPGYVTGVAFADPRQQAATVSGSFVDNGGTAIADTHTVSIPQRGHNAEVLANFFPATQGKRGAAHFSAASSIFGLGIRANGKAFTTIEAIAGVSRTGGTFAHIASGGGWKTTFQLVNTDTVAGQFKLEFWDDNGNPLTLALGADGNAASVTDTIPPGGLRIIQASAGSALKTGSASLSSPGEMQPAAGIISGTAIFGLQAPGQADSEAAVPMAQVPDTHLYMPFDYTQGYSTGVAIATAVGNEPATVSLAFFDESGTSLSPGDIVTIPANGHVSKVLADLFPGIVGKRGTISLMSDWPIFALGIRANGVAFTTMKVIAPVLSSCVPQKFPCESTGN